MKTLNNEHSDSIKDLKCNETALFVCYQKIWNLYSIGEETSWELDFVKLHEYVDIIPAVRCTVNSGLMGCQDILRRVKDATRSTRAIHTWNMINNLRVLFRIGCVVLNGIFVINWLWDNIRSFTNKLYRIFLRC